MFFTQRAIEEDIADWVEDRFATLLEHFSSTHPVHETELILPNDARFNVTETDAEARARTLFEATVASAGFCEQTFDLVALEDDTPPTTIAAHMQITAGNSDRTIWGVSDVQSYKISFAKDLIGYPVNLVATYARELARKLVKDKDFKAAIDSEDAELVVDLCTVYLGFGVFKANAAFEIERSAGDLLGRWSSRQQGYLTENSLTYATALFCTIKDDGFEEARNALKPRLQGVFDRAMKQIGRRGDQWGLFELDRSAKPEA